MVAIAAASLRVLLDDESVFKFNQEQTNQHLFEEKEAGPRNRKGVSCNWQPVNRLTRLSPKKLQADGGWGH